jgi:aryl-alcohol dehydrogenase-like predicted oxidoreductase
VTAVLRPAVLRAQLDESLRRLGVDEVDTYLLHHPDESGIPIEESWGMIAELIDEGKARYGGLCGFDLSELRRCEGVRHVDVFEGRLTPLNADSALPIARACEEQGTDFVAWGPCATGRLLDPTFSGPLAGSPFDHPRRRLRRLAAADIVAETASANAMYGVARHHGLPAEAVAAAWMLAQPGVTAVAVGVARPSQLDRWVQGIVMELPPADLEEIGRAACPDATLS